MGPTQKCIEEFNRWLASSLDFLRRTQASRLREDTRVVLLTAFNAGWNAGVEATIQSLKDLNKQRNE